MQTAEKFSIAFFSLLFIFTLVVCLPRIYLGNLPWWFDPGRDMILSLNNLKKFTLIGPPTGIPGVFYGVWWIWALSLSQLISLDPRLAAFLVAFLPYVILAPLFYKKLFNGKIAVILWTLFISTFYGYTTALWNVHPAPLVFLVLTFFLINTDLSWPQMGFLGFLAGHAINFNVSFGSAVFFGTLAYLAVLLLKNTKISLGKKILLLAIFCAGCTVSFAPFLIFETRHGFNQIKVIQNTLYQAVIGGKAVVSVRGLTKSQILYHFLFGPEKLFYIPRILGWLAITGSFIYILVFKKLTAKDKKLLLVIGLVLASMVGLYFGWKNPVWEYHFIGYETLILLLCGWLAFKFKPFFYFLIPITLWAMFNRSQVLYKEFTGPLYSVGDLKTKQHIVDTVYQDAGDGQFSFFAYNPALYTWDYDYLFLASQKKFHAKANKEIKGAKTIYLIIPETSDALFQDFINYRTPRDKYTTVKEWKIPDKTTILKRVKIGK